MNLLDERVLYDRYPIDAGKRCSRILLILMASCRGTGNPIIVRSGHARGEPYIYAFFIQSHDSTLRVNDTHDGKHFRRTPITEIQMVKVIGMVEDTWYGNRS
jgi:hypothetical protein